MLRSPFLDKLGLLIVLLLIVAIGIKNAFPDLWSEKVNYDFDAFLTVGDLHARGEVSRAYEPAFMFDALKTRFGEDRRLPWAYPPPFNVVAVLLAQLPDGTALPLFELGCFLVLLLALRRLEPDEPTFVLLCAFPAVVINLMCGQNGTLTAALAGLTSLCCCCGSAAPPACRWG